LTKKRRREPVIGSLLFVICLEAVERRETENHPLCGWGIKVIQKISPIDYNKVVQVYCRKKGEMYGKPNKQSGAYQMDVQVPYRVYSEVS